MPLVPLSFLLLRHLMQSLLAAGIACALPGCWPCSRLSWAERGHGQGPAGCIGPAADLTPLPPASPSTAEPGFPSIPCPLLD